MRTTDDDAVAPLARPLRDGGDLDPLLDRIGDARVVAIGEELHQRPLHLERADERLPLAEAV